MPEDGILLKNPNSNQESLVQSDHPMSRPDPKNRLNDLDSRSWLQFQKSWFILDQPALPAFVRFFTKARYADGHAGTIAILPETPPAANACPGRAFVPLKAATLPPLDYAFVDLTTPATQPLLAGDFRAVLEAVELAAANLRPRAYLTLSMKNQRAAGRTYPLAWHCARLVAKILQLKDEKIGCLPASAAQNGPWTGTWLPDDSIIYFMNFRKENSGHPAADAAPEVWPAVAELPDAAANRGRQAFRQAWFVHKPPPRNKEVLLHPAKFPEDLIRSYIENFTRPGDRVLDPMAGTGSTLVAAQQCNRVALGIELNPRFAQIATQRRNDALPFQLIIGDARERKSYAHLPSEIAYCITSPPYWDMLRMRGAETQAARKAAGLPRWYSDDDGDLGNIVEYEIFLDMLEVVYNRVFEKLSPAGHLTVIVKNVKKKGKIYPLAWDLSRRLCGRWIFAGEQIWCQDDQRLAPFGYRYAWVSNTFHHYCLTFRKPR